MVAVGKWLKDKKLHQKKTSIHSLHQTSADQSPLSPFLTAKVSGLLDNEEIRASGLKALAKGEGSSEFSHV